MVEELTESTMHKGADSRLDLFMAIMRMKDIEDNKSKMSDLDRALLSIQGGPSPLAGILPGLGGALAPQLPPQLPLPPGIGGPGPLPFSQGGAPIAQLAAGLTPQPPPQPPESPAIAIARQIIQNKGGGL